MIEGTEKIKRQYLKQIRVDYTNLFNVMYTISLFNKYAY